MTPLPFALAPALAPELDLKNVSVGRCELAVHSALHRIVMVWKEPWPRGMLTYESHRAIHYS